MDPRLIALMQMAQRAKQPVRRFADGDFVDYDFGGFDAGDFNVGDFDASSFDIGDLSALLGDLTGGGDAGETIDMLTRGGAGEDDVGAYYFSPGEFDQFLAQQKIVNAPGEDSATGGIDLGSFEDLAASEQQSKLQDLFGSSIQDLGAKGTLTDEGLLQIGGYDRPGGMTSQWQTSGSDRIMIQDDGSAIGINTETGESYSLPPEKVDQMVKNGQLNTFGSGYNTATGGNLLAPGGGKQVTLGDGKTVILKPDGTVLDKNGNVITNTNTIKETITKVLGGGGGGGGGGGQQKKSDLSSLLPLLLMMLMMNRQSGGTSSASIPALSASQTQTPYGAIQQAAGYRPGQGGITYFNPIQYAPKMAGGGIADLAMMKQGGRLLHGPGDGVSDSIPATIGGQQPARLARGEYVIDARTVAELGNGSTDAGAERLDEMRQRVLSKRKQAKMGQDTRAYKHLPA